MNDCIRCGGSGVEPRIRWCKRKECWSVAVSLNLCVKHYARVRDGREEIDMLGDELSKERAEVDKYQLESKSIPATLNEAVNFWDAYGRTQRRLSFIERERVLHWDEIDPDPPQRIPQLMQFAEPMPIRGGKTDLLYETEKKTILQTLDEVGGNRTVAAARLGINVRTLTNKLQLYKKGNPPGGIKAVADDFVMDSIKRTLSITKGNKSEAARILGLNRTTLVEKLKREEAHA